MTSGHESSCWGMRRLPEKACLPATRGWVGPSLMAEAASPYSDFHAPPQR